MTHIYDWLDNNENNEEVKKLRDFLDFRTRDAVYQMNNQNKLPKYAVHCIYKDKTYRLTGASRMGDVWLHSNLNRNTGYTLRVGIDDCTNFSYVNSNIKYPNKLRNTSNKKQAIDILLFGW